MSTLPEIIHYLDTTARVSCPQITCEQAAELAEVLREYSEENSQLCDQYNELSDAVGEHEKAYGVEALNRIDQRLDDTEQAACGFAWDCGREIGRLLDGEFCSQLRDKYGNTRCVNWRKPCREHSTLYENRSALRKECQAWMDAYKREKDLNAMLRNCVADLERDKAYRERVDAGLPIVGDTTTWEEATGDHKEEPVAQNKVVGGLSAGIPKYACDNCSACDDEDWPNCRNPWSDTGDLDPGIYEGTGKGFEK